MTAVLGALDVPFKVLPVVKRKCKACGEILAVVASFGEPRKCLRCGATL